MKMEILSVFHAEKQSHLVNRKHVYVVINLYVKVVLFTTGNFNTVTFAKNATSNQRHRKMLNSPELKGTGCQSTLILGE